MHGKSPNLIFCDPSRVIISDRIADAPVFGLEDLLDFSFAMSDVVGCTADRSIFDDVADLEEILRALFSNANGNQTNLELSLGNWHYEVIDWFVLKVVVVVC